MNQFTSPQKTTASNPTKVLQVALIGYGYWGQIIASNISLCAAIKLTHICDGNPTNLEVAHEEFTDAECVTELDAVLASPEVDLVVIATPTRSHFPIAKRCIEAGKHIFVEKPFVETLAQAFAIKSLAEETGVEIFVDHTFLFTSEVQEIKRLIDAGELGELMMIDSCRMNFGKFQPDVNVAWDLGPHDLSIIKHFTGGKPMALYAEGSDCLKRGIQDTVHISLKFPGDLMAYLHMSWISPRKERRMIITGSESMLIYDDAEPDMKIRLYSNKLVTKATDSGYLDFSYQMGDTRIPKTRGGSALAREFEYVAQVINKEIPHTINTVDDAIWVLRMLTETDKILRKQAMSLGFSSILNDNEIA